MIVSCPNCQTTYNLADDRAKPGVKLRCTVCKQVFTFQHPDATKEKSSKTSAAASSSAVLQINIGDAAAPKKRHLKKGSSRGKLVFLLLLLCIGAGAGYAWHFTSWLDPVKATFIRPAQTEMDESARAAKLAEMVSLLEMRGVRQYTVPNEKLGKITVIEGKVINGFTQPRELIRLEVSLFNDKGELLLTKSQLAGTMISLFQLQVLDKDELERALNNKLDILSNNTNIPPGAQVPFMLVVYEMPADASDFSLKIIDARLPEAKP